MSYPQVVTASLYQANGSTLVTALTDAFGITFMDELSGYGTGALSLSLTDSNADELTSGRIIKISVGGTVRFVWRIEGNPDYSQVDLGEEYAQILTASGRGWGMMLEDGIIYPEFDLTLPLDSAWRLFSFAAPSFPNGGSWPVSTELYEYHDGVAEGLRYVAIADADDVVSYYPSPVGFPWPNSPKNGNGLSPTPTYIETFWIWPSAAAEDDVGYAFFRDTFTTVDPQPITFSVTGDNLFTLFLEGVPILGEDNDELMWLGYKEVTVNLPAGTYQMAAVVQNVSAPALAFNPGGFLYAAYVSASDVGGETVAWVHAQVSNAEWTSHFSATTWPGWTPGQIIQKLIDEADTRGSLQIPAGLATSFTALEDTDSNDWDSLDSATTSIYIPSFAIEVGKTIGACLTQLHEEGWIDWHVRPTGPTLDVWTAGEVGSASGITFAAGVNITRLERGATKPYANALLVQWSKGFVEVLDAAEITAFGSRVEDVFSTDADSLEDAERMGRIELDRRAQSARAAIVLGIEPVSAADAPYEAFQLGDTIVIPNEAGTGTETKQVLSISCQQDEEGYAIWTLEVGKRWMNKNREIGELLRNIGGKTLGSASDHGVVD